jgi:hypothetical protein
MRESALVKEAVSMLRDGVCPFGEASVTGAATARTLPSVIAPLAALTDGWPRA